MALKVGSTIRIPNAKGPNEGTVTFIYKDGRVRVLLPIRKLVTLQRWSYAVVR